VKKKQRPYILIDDPSPFDCLETWERFLAEVQEMPDFVTKQIEIRSAKWMIASIMKKSGGSTRGSFVFSSQTTRRPASRMRRKLCWPRSIREQKGQRAVGFSPRRRRNDPPG
jgi:hypothetical protein